MVITILHGTFSTIWEKLDFFYNNNMDTRDFLPYFMKNVVTQILKFFNLIYGNIFTIFLYQLEIFCHEQIW